MIFRQINSTLKLERGLNIIIPQRIINYKNQSINYEGHYYNNKFWFYSPE